MPRAATTRTRTSGSDAGRGAQGFTLVELLVALALMALALAVALPLFTGSSGLAELRSAARELSSALRASGVEAIRRNEEVVFTLDVDSRSYAVEGSRYAGRLPETVALELTTAASERRGRTRGNIRFFPDGSSTGGWVVLRSGERALRVGVDWMTGKVGIDD